MKRRLLFLSAFVAVIMLLLSSCKRDYFPPACNGDATVTTSKVFATGFNNPRGLKFGPDGNLYVAEGGTVATIFRWDAPRLRQLYCESVWPDKDVTSL